MNNIEIKIFDFFISEKSKKSIEKYVLVASVISFIFHLILIYLNKFEIVKIKTKSIHPSTIKKQRRKPR